MKARGNHLSLRPPLSAAGAVAASALVWYVGPLFTIGQSAPLASSSSRAMAVCALLLLGAVFAAWTMARTARSNQRLMEGLAGPGGALPGAREAAVLDQRFTEAVALLKRSRLGGQRPLMAALAGRPFFYQLPWYVIIGAPGAGKTTALVNSGLEFPLASNLGQKVIRGMGGTRNCDWWFAADAVLIDTAGRYTTQDSDKAADRGAWLAFLALLTRHRPGRPINGVLLSISVSDLLNADANKRLAHARELRGRIDELHANLGIRFPIYVLVTKTDLLAGFMEFFADFDKDERAQVWGVTFPHSADALAQNPLAPMASDFAALEKRLNECLLDRLHSESDRERRAALYAFPQQWRVLHETLLEFLQTVFAARSEPLQPMLRGVYFTSATQEGTPMDRALGGLARALGLTSRMVAPARPSGKTFFVTRLLRDVVFAEAGLAGTRLRWEQRRSLLKWGMLGLTILGVAGAVALSARAYVTNRAYVASVGDRATALERSVAAAKGAAPTDMVALLPALDALQALSLADEASPSAALAPIDMGLDRHEMLVTAGQDAYQRLLKEGFLPRIAARLEQRLRNGGQEHVELIYESLRSYLMLFSGRNFDRPALRAYLSADWDATLPDTVTSAQRDALRRHLDRLLAGSEVGAPTNVDPQLVASARSLVAGVPLAQRAYHRIKQLDPGADAPAFSVESAGGPAARGVFVRASGEPLSAAIPGLYSRGVFQQSMRKRTEQVLRQFAQEQSWVLGAAPPAGAQAVSQEALIDDIERQYVTDYTRLWDTLLADLRLAPSASLANSAEMARVLARPDSPLLAVLGAVVRQVSTGPRPGSASPAASAPGTAPSELAVIDPKFDALRQYLGGPSPPIGDVLALLGRVSVHLAAADDAARRKAPPPAGDPVRDLAVAALRAPEPVRGMLAQLAQTGAAQAFAVAREPLSRQLAAELTAPCTRSVAGRYPLARAATEEVSREEFARTFAAGGVVDGFFQRSLASVVDTAAAPWAYRHLEGAKAEAGEALQQFQRALWIRDAFFRDGGRTLGVRLEFRLVEMDAGVAQFSLDIDGQALRFTREQRNVQSVQWPGATDSGRVHLQLTPSAGGAAGPGYEFAGPWALLRLFDRVRVEAADSADRVQVVFDVEGRKARFEIRSATPRNPLLRQDLEQFQCPKRL